MISLKWATVLGNLSMFVSQEESEKREKVDVAVFVFLLQTLRREEFISLVAAAQSTSFCKVELMQEALLLLMLR